MPNKKYVLCVRVKEKNSTRYYELASVSLLGLAKYTSYCVDSSELLRCMPSSAKDILSRIIGYYSVEPDSFAIRTSSSKGAKTIPILYAKDIDVLLSNKDDLEQILYRLGSITLNEYENDAIPKAKEEFLKLLYKEFGDKELKPKMNDNVRKKLDPDGFPDARYGKPLQTGWIALGMLKQNLDALIEINSSDFYKKQKLGLMLKHIINQELTVGVTKTENEKRLLKVEQVLERRRESNYYIRQQITKNCMGISHVLFNQSTTTSKTQNKWADEYLLTDQEKHIAMKVDELKVVIGGCIESQKRNFKPEIDDEIVQLNLKLAELEYQLDGLETGRIVASDAGFLIEKTI